MNPAVDEPPASVQLVPAFDQAPASVIGGDGALARYPGILAVFGRTDPAVDARNLQRLLAICADVSAGGARAPGRRLARQLGLWLDEVDGRLNLGTVAATEGGLAVFLSGTATLHIQGRPGLTGADTAAWLDRVVDWPADPFVLSLSNIAPTFAVSVFDLRAGVVPGSGAVVAPPAQGGASPAAAAGEALGASDPIAVDPAAAPSSPVADVPPAKAPLVPPARSARIDTGDPVPPRPPLPVHPAAGEEPRPSMPGEPPQVQGFLCSRGHLNDPRALFCGLCGIRMAERTGVLTIGRRPPLGLLVFDDGVTFTVDAGYLVGREPESDDRVRNGVLRPLMLIDRRGAVSRRHAEIALDGWNVLLSDVGSANGTFVSARGSDAWSALLPHRPIALLSGTKIRMGSRMMVFESPHGGA